MGVNFVASLGEGDLAPNTFQQGHCQLILQLFDLHRDRRLGKVKFFGGPRETAVAGYRGKRAKLSECNVHKIKYKIYLYILSILFNFLMY